MVVKVNSCLKTLNAFRASYEEHKAKLKTYYKEGEKVNEWEFAAPLVFARYDKFVERVSTMKVGLSCLCVSSEALGLVFLFFNHQICC